jgi:hypothetical protein
MAQRRLNTLGEVNAHCAIGNCPERMKKLQEVLELKASIDAISEIQTKSKEQKVLEQETVHEALVCRGGG